MIEYKIQQMINELAIINSEAMCYRMINERNNDANQYVLQHIKQSLIRTNIWHVILDDAIALRRENEELKKQIEDDLLDDKM